MTYFEEQIERQLFKSSSPFYPGRWAGLSESRRQQLILQEIKRLQRDIKTSRKKMIRAEIENGELRQLKIV